MEGSEILTEIEKAEFFNYEPYKKPIELHYKNLEISKLDAVFKYDHRLLFLNEPRTVYSDNCCHFNSIGMETIVNAITKDGTEVFDALLGKNVINFASIY